MGTHPIFESDFDCLTEIKMTKSTRKSSSPQAVTERILAECHEIYTDEENGLLGIAKSLDHELMAPRKKITVMLIGNHSAGKSSFINWYIEEHIQRTGVAIETQGFTIVTSGRKRETLTGNATCHLYPHFKPLTKIEGMMNYIHTEVTTSLKKKSGLIHFCDTPGLVDGDMKYPFDVNEAILWMSDLADLVLVFFDPIGQALCKRTLDVVEALSEENSEKLRFFLSKADEAGDESDRQRVLMQIVQELCRRPSLNQTCFDMPTIYINKDDKPKRCVNQIQHVCEEISKTINMTLQKTLNQLEVDCEQIQTLVDEKIEIDNENKMHNVKANVQFLACAVFVFLMPIISICNLISSQMCSTATSGLCAYLDSVSSYPDPINGFVHLLGPDNRHYALGAVVIVLGGAVAMLKYSFATKPTLTRRDKKMFEAQAKYVREQVLPKKETLYKEYLTDSVGEI